MKLAKALREVVSKEHEIQAKNAAYESGDIDKAVVKLTDAEQVQVRTHTLKNNVFVVNMRGFCAKMRHFL